MSKPLVGAPIGADVDGVYTGTTTDGANAPAQLGTVVRGIDGTQYVLVQAGASLMASTDAPNAVAIDENYQAALMTTALAAAGHALGFAPQAVIADNAFFWARTSGSNFNARVAASSAADAFLRTSATAGRLGVGSTASAVYFPAVLVVAASASTSAGNSVREVLAGQMVAVRIGGTGAAAELP
jgi:hypothetical protein